ncbi:MAG: Zn-finger nucleic acid-binding protein [Planctomycetota bacterium]|jgi:Zn-finger nucleic acid-binding protein
MLLIACPDCARQYDVTGLEPGRQVRCFCEKLFTVGWPPKLAAGALTCTHCGGAVSVSDESCPYCEAGISEEDRRQSTLCPGCFTRIDDDSKHCRSCGLDIRPQSLAPLPVDRDCPRCKGKLRVRSLEVLDLVECSACLGMWLTPDTFKKITNKAARERGAEQLFPVESVEPETVVERVRYIPCLHCGELMNRRQFIQSGQSSGTVIDLCRKHGVWLDHKELERIIEFIRNHDQSAGPTPTLNPAAFVVTKRNRRGESPQERNHDWILSALETIGDVLFFGYWFS